MKFFERIHHRIEVVATKGAESFVDEQGVDRELLLVEGGESQGQSQRDEETFASRQSAYRTGDTSFVIIA